MFSHQLTIYLILSIVWNAWRLSWLDWMRTVRPYQNLSWNLHNTVICPMMPIFSKTYVVLSYLDYNFPWFGVYYCICDTFDRFTKICCVCRRPLANNRSSWISLTMTLTTVVESSIGLGQLFRMLHFLAAESTLIWNVWTVTWRNWILVGVMYADNSLTGNL